MQDFWRKRVFIPCWIIQIIAAGIYVIAGAVAIAAGKAVEDGNDNGYFGDQNTTYNGYTLGQVAGWVTIAGGVFLGVGAVAIIFNLVEIICFARHKLNPWTVVIQNSIQVVVWLALFIILIINAVNGGANGLDWVLTAALLSTSITKLIYGSTTLHRYRKGQIGSRGAYAPAQAEAGLYQSTAYSNNAHQNLATPDPFRDPSRASSPVPEYNKPQPQVGAAQEYYDPHRGGADIEMQHQPPAHHGETRYA